MHYFLKQVAYTKKHGSNCSKKPKNADVLHPAIEEVGGKVMSGFLSILNYKLGTTIQCTVM